MIMALSWFALGHFLVSNRFGIIQDERKRGYQFFSLFFFGKELMLSVFRNVGATEVQGDIVRTVLEKALGYDEDVIIIIILVLCFQVF